MAGLSRILAADSLDLITARTSVLSGVVQALPVMSWASLTSANGRSRPVTLAASGDTAQLVDGIQYDTGVGPCLQAVAEMTVVRADDLSREDRWAPFVATALSDSPVRAVVSFSLADGGHPEISLNLYAAQPLFADRLIRTASPRPWQRARWRCRRSTSGAGPITWRRRWTPAGGSVPRSAS